MTRPQNPDLTASAGIRITRGRKMLVADLLCGAGGSSTGAQRALAELGLEMDLVCVNHWPVAIATHERNHPEARHHVQDIATVRPHLLVPEGYLDLLMASPTCTHHSVARGGKPTSDQQRSDPWHIITWLTELRVKRLIIENVWEFCFPPETAVLTKRGMMPIGDIKVGDEVWTHNARWKPVTRVTRRKSSTVRVTGYGNSIVEATPNHEFYVRQVAPQITVSGKRGRHEGRLLEPEWVRADRLADKDESSSYTRQYSGYCWATPKELPRYWIRLPKVLGVDVGAVAFFYMLGRWLGDGWIKKRKDGRQDIVRICANLGEADELECRLAETGLTWRRANHTPTVDIFDLSAASSKHLIRWLRANFGEYAHAKTLPAWIYGASAEQRWALIEGYHDADGNERADGVTAAATVSRQLAVGMKLLLQSLGVAAAITRTAAHDGPSIGREGISAYREAFHVSWRRDTEWEKGDRRDLHIWGRIRTVEPCRDDVEVVDITVADDHSFIADGQVVHNCGWGPVDHRTGKPVASRKGEYFRAWIDTIKRLGFQPEWRKLNAADYGDATTRSRFILMARSDRKRLVWPVATHHRRNGAVDLFSGAQPWRPAREIIDWSIKGRSIFDRKKALAPKTLARIYSGAQKHGWPEPFLVILRNHMAAQGMDMPLPAITAGGTHIGLAQPVLIKQNFRRDVVAIDEPAPTVMTQARLGLAEPVIVNMKGQSTATAAGEPLPTQTAHAGHLYAAEPIILSEHNTGAARAAADPLPTVTTEGAASERPGCARPMLVEPFVLSAAHGVDVGETDPHSRRTKSVDDPLGTVHAGGGNFGVVEPFVVSRHAGGAPRSIDDPTPTQVAKHSHLLISPYYGSGSGETCTAGDNPLPTVTSKGRFGMVVPVTQSGGGAAARNLADALPTMTTAKGGEFAVVMPVTHHDGSDRVRDAALDPLPTVTGANRGELAFIAAQFGEREGQAPRVHDLDDPAPTLCATGRVNLVEGTDGYDILFRMLEPHELAAAMGFNTDDARYEFTGTKTQQIKQIGNAVSVAKMKACVAAIMADAAPVRSEPPVSITLFAAE